MNHLTAAGYIGIAVVFLFVAGVKLMFHFKCLSLAVRGDKEGLEKIILIRLIVGLMILCFISPLVFMYIGHWIWLLLILGFVNACLVASGWFVDLYMNMYECNSQDTQNG